MLDETGLFYRVDKCLIVSLAKSKECLSVEGSADALYVLDHVNDVLFGQRIPEEVRHDVRGIPCHYLSSRIYDRPSEVFVVCDNRLSRLQFHLRTKQPEVDVLKCLYLWLCGCCLEVVLE